MLHRIRLNETDENQSNAFNQNEDALIENQTMTERVMTAMNTQRDDVNRHEVDIEDLRHPTRDNANSNSSSSQDSIHDRLDKVRKNQINDDDEEDDDDEILRNLLNV